MAIRVETVEGVKVTRVFRAHLPEKDEPVEKAILEITLDIPTLKDLSVGLDKVHEMYDVEAAAIMDVLFNHLPQGTMHRLLIKMLQRYPSYYVGPGPEVKHV
jgi:hypothetical protein